jgi:hypothetical protein
MMWRTVEKRRGNLCICGITPEKKMGYAHVENEASKKHEAVGCWAATASTTLRETPAEINAGRRRPGA